MELALADLSDQSTCVKGGQAHWHICVQAQTLSTNQRAALVTSLLTAFSTEAEHRQFLGSISKDLASPHDFSNSTC
jgi:hypothetical protein